MLYVVVPESFIYCGHFHFSFPSKSEVIGRCGWDRKTQWPRITDKSRTLKSTLGTSIEYYGIFCIACKILNKQINAVYNSIITAKMSLLGICSSFDTLIVTRKFKLSFGLVEGYIARHSSWCYLSFVLAVGQWHPKVSFNVCLCKNTYNNQ